MFFPVFAFPPLPCYPMPFLLPFPFTLRLAGGTLTVPVFLASSHEKARGHSVHMFFT